jgi:hypothetical protein
VTTLAFSRPFLPLFLHVFGTMILYGVVITAIITSLVGRPRAAFTTLLVAIPAWIVAWVGAIWIESKEDLPGDPAWIGIGHITLEGSLVLCLLPSIFFAWRWKKRNGEGIAGRVVTGLTTLSLLALTVAMLAMSGKWGS